MTAVSVAAFMLLVAGTVGVATVVVWIVAHLTYQLTVRHWPRSDINSVPEAADPALHEDLFTVEDWAEISTYMRKAADQ